MKGEGLRFAVPATSALLVYGVWGRLVGAGGARFRHAGSDRDQDIPVGPVEPDVFANA